MAFANRGKRAESEVQRWLNFRSDADSAFAFHRFPDARAARGALAAQPSDMLVICQGVPTFLEIKETSEAHRLSRSKITQYGALKKMMWAGAQIVVLVYRSKFNDWLYLRGRELFYYDVLPPSFPFKDRPLFPTAAAALESAFA